MTNRKKFEDLELRLLLEGIAAHYGYDFRDYAPASIKRRILKCVGDEKAGTVLGLLDLVLHDPAAMQRLLWTISINVTAMFRDPGFYVAFRKKVVPGLKSYPFIRIWHAGCATGEEVYSLAIVLVEEGLYDKSLLYATDMNEAVLAKAREGIFPLKAMQDYTDNYIRTGGTRSFSEYYTARYGNSLFAPDLKKNMVWAQHNLVTDASFNEFNVILCRNVMIYFNRSLQYRVHALLYESLTPGGVLVLGSKENLKFSPFEDRYELLDGRERLYRKVR